MAMLQDILNNIIANLIADYLKSPKIWVATITSFLLTLWASIAEAPGYVQIIIALGVSVLVLNLLDGIITAWRWFRGYSKAGTRNLVSTAITSESPKEPTVYFGSPIQGADMDRDWFLSWWHIPVSLEVMQNPSIRSYEHCTAKLKLERCYPNGSYPTEKPKTYDMRCQSRDGAVAEFALRTGDEPKKIPIARRTEEIPSDLANQFKSWDQDITDDQYFIMNPSPLLPGRYELTLEIRSSDYNKQWISQAYILTVPQGGTGGRSNGHFILSVKVGT
ncbi:MAG: hypothetical protein HYY45_06960 [Deltaproteobacteria bacterium]|nr:hypothetical protein [Deltaproteobacteria bacterium]